MTRLIDADDFFRVFPELAIEPYINATTVEERPKGEWIVKGQDIYCSVCNQESAFNEFGASKFSNFCPNCGADMREADNDKID